MANPRKPIIGQSVEGEKIYILARIVSYQLVSKKKRKTKKKKKSAVTFD
jgi:hypothetical protein